MLINMPINMPAPPSEIHVKRKATDDPVDLLCIHNEVGGLQQIGKYVFKRQRVSMAVSSESQQVVEPLQSLLSTEVPLVDTHTGRQDFSDQASIQETKREGKDEAHLLITQRTTGSSTDSMNTSQSQNMPVGVVEPRRFHISRTDAMSFTEQTASGRGQKVVFIEKKNDSSSLSKVANGKISNDLKSKLPVDLTPQPESAASYAEPSQPNPPAPLRNVEMPSGKTVPWDARPEELDADMKAYTLEVMGRNISQFSSAAVVPTKNSSRFKPRAPARRLNQPPAAERAPASGQEKSVDVAMTDAADEKAGNSDYIIDTFVRMPAEMFDSTGKAQNMGLLVLENQPDFEEFYNVYSDNESDTYYDEEEDENAENHPSNDYPEEELESDDEYGRNPYKYYHDSDEYDAYGDNDGDDDGLMFSDDEDNERSTPLRRMPLWMKNPGIFGYEIEEEYDD